LRDYLVAQFGGAAWSNTFAARAKADLPGLDLGISTFVHFGRDLGRTPQIWREVPLAH
jgi:hypothetical protein